MANAEFLSGIQTRQQKLEGGASNQRDLVKTEDWPSRKLTKFKKR